MLIFWLSVEKNINVALCTLLRSHNLFRVPEMSMELAQDRFPDVEMPTQELSAIAAQILHHLEMDFPDEDQITIRAQRMLQISKRHDRDTRIQDAVSDFLGAVWAEMHVSGNISGQLHSRFSRMRVDADLEEQAMQILNRVLFGERKALNRCLNESR